MDPSTTLKGLRNNIELQSDTVSESAMQQLLELDEKLVSIKAEIKKELEEKRLISSQFKHAKGDKDAIASLKASMQANTKLLTELEAHKKAIEQNMLSLLESNAPNADDEPALPQQFLPTAEEIDTPVTVNEIGDKDQAAWDKYVESHPQANLYQQYCWREIITASFGHKSFYLAAYQNNTIVGVLPIVWLKSRLFGSFGVSVPFFNYGGPLANTKKIASDLIQHAIHIAEQNNFSHLEIRTTTDQFALPAETRKVSMILKLPKSTEELDNQLGAKVRAQAKQADNYQPSIKFGGVELLTDFYKVFSENMRDLGTPVYGKDIFLNILQHKNTQPTIAVTYIKNKPVGAAFLLGHREMMEIPWASTLKSANPMNINMWMYHNILHYSIDKGYAFFDFGRSTVGAGTYRFKKQWGAKPIKHYWYNWHPEGQAASELNPDNPKFKLMIAAWKKLPLFVANIIGPYLVKNLP